MSDASVTPVPAVLNEPIRSDEYHSILSLLREVKSLNAATASLVVGTYRVDVTFVSDGPPEGDRMNPAHLY